MNIRRRDAVFYGYARRLQPRMPPGYQRGMRGLLTSRASRVAALLACLAAVLAGAAMPSPAVADPRLVAFVAAGGTLDDICGEAGHGSAGDRHCDACLLLGPALLPGTVAPVPARTARAVAADAPAPATPSVPARAANQPRAPPVRS